MNMRAKFFGAIAGGIVFLSASSNAKAQCPTVMAVTQTPSGCGADVSYAVTNPNGFQFIEFTLDGEPLSTQQTGSVYLEAGTYVIATSTADINNCTSYLEESITVAPSLSVQFQNNTVACNGTLALSAGVSGGSGNYSYAWQPSAMMNDASAATPSMTVGNTATLVSLAVTDLATGCIRTNQMSVYPNQGVSQTVELCGSMADLILDPGSVMYNWIGTDVNGNAIDMTGVNSNIYFATEPGTYVVVTYYTGCNVITHQFIVEECSTNPCPTSMTLTQQAEGCGANVSYAVTNPNGFQFIEFTLDGTPISTQSSGIVYLEPGTYVIASSTADANNCTRYLEETITILPTITVQFQNIASTCTEQCLGSAMALASGGSPPYEYIWGDGSTTGQNNTLCLGLNSVIITDGLGCSVTADVLVEEFPVIELEVTSTIVIENCTTTVCLDANSGFASYLWSTGELTQQICGFWTQGDYEITLIVEDGVYGCIQSASVLFTVDACNDDVWPGDANSDGEATNTDALWVGLAFNQTGPVRAAASNAWIGQPATDWTFDFAQNGVNLKHADCDGNGVINFADTIAISQNYGQTHGKTESALSGGYPLLWVEATPDTVGLSQAVNITVHLADAAMPVDSLHGIAFTLTFNETLVVADDLAIDFSNNTLGTVGSDVLTLQKPFFPNGEVDVAISRTTLENYAGFGPLLTARIVTTDNLSGVHELRIGISGVTAITASEIPVLFTTVADTVFIDSERVGINDLTELDFRVYPNPSQGVFQLEGLEGNVNVEVMDATGRVVERLQNNGNGKLTVNMSYQTAGMYVMRVWNETGFAVKRIELLGH